MGLESLFCTHSQKSAVKEGLYLQFLAGKKKENTSGKLNT